MILFGLFENQPPSTSLGTDVSFVLVTLLSGMSRVSIRGASDQQKVDGNKPVKQKYTIKNLTSHSFSQLEKTVKQNKKTELRVSFPDTFSSPTGGCPLAVQWPPAWYHQLTEESQCSLTFRLPIHPATRSCYPFRGFFSQKKSL